MCGKGDLSFKCHPISIINSVCKQQIRQFPYLVELAPLLKLKLRDEVSS